MLSGMKVCAGEEAAERLRRKELMVLIALNDITMVITFPIVGIILIPSAKESIYCWLFFSLVNRITKSYEQISMNISREASMPKNVGDPDPEVFRGFVSTARRGTRASPAHLRKRRF